MDSEIRLRIEELKVEIINNIAVEDDLSFIQCEELIELGKKVHDNQAIAFGYVWKADYFFYTHYDLDALANELSRSGIYIDESKPSELLEKYFTLFRLFYENSFDIQSALLYCLKALDIAESCKLTDRIVANYGTIGTYYNEFGYYEEALSYTEKAINEITDNDARSKRMLRVLLANSINMCIKLEKYDQAKTKIDELSSLEIEKEDLLIYVDYAKTLYYAATNDADLACKYLNEMFKDGLLLIGNKGYIVEILLNSFDAMLEIENQVKSKELLDLMDELIKEEASPLLMLCRKKIAYYTKYIDSETLEKCYVNFYRLHNQMASQVNEFKSRGLHAKMQLMDAYYEQEEIIIKIEELRNQVNFDELTKVYNRRYLNIKRNEFISNPDIYSVGYVIVDLDYFKEFNDSYGHIEGDKALILVATCLKRFADDNLIVSRYGGDEFVVLCYNISEEKLRKYINKVREELYIANMKHETSNCSDRVSCSIGYGIDKYNSKQSHISLFDKVDEALYRSKQTGRNSMTSITEL